MSSDYERWKKRRDAERARRERDAEAPPRRPTAPPAGNPSRPRAEDPYEPARSYQGHIPLAPEPAPRKPRRQGQGRGCVGCLGLLVGGVLFLGLCVMLTTFLYWRQIEQRGQVNVLILGIDERPNEGDSFRSDTMILAGFDPRERQVALLSIPRDLWVNVPGIGQNRINTAHFYGGPVLAMQTIQSEFGVPVNYYVKLNFDGFVAFVDALGGITVDVQEPLHDENYPTPDYGITTIDIPAGTQQMDGATALIYARSRYSTSDFDRARRQQQIIGAIREKLSDPGMWLQAPRIYAAAFSAIDTDIPQSEWFALAMMLVRSEIERLAIGPEMVKERITPEGAQVLEPEWNLINPLLARFFE